MIFTKCKSADEMAGLCKKIDEMYRNSDYPDPHPDRGSVREDVRGDARRLEGHDLENRGRRGLLAVLRRGKLDGDVDAGTNERSGDPQGDRIRPRIDPGDGT